jgi:hypothetical protein
VVLFWLRHPVQRIPIQHVVIYQAISDSFQYDNQMYKSNTKDDPQVLMRRMAQHNTLGLAMRLTTKHKVQGGRISY